MPKNVYVFIAISLVLGEPSAKAQRMSFRAPSFRAPNMGARFPIKTFRPLRPALMGRNRFAPVRPTRHGLPVRESPRVGSWSRFNAHSFAKPAPGSLFSVPSTRAHRSSGSNASPARPTESSRFSAHSFAKPGPGPTTSPRTSRSPGSGPTGRTFAAPVGPRSSSSMGPISPRFDRWFGTGIFVGSFPSPFFANAFLFPTFPRFLVFNSFFFSPFFFARPFFFPSFLNPFFTSPFGFFNPFFFSGTFVPSTIFFGSLFIQSLPACLPPPCFALLWSSSGTLTEPPVLGFGGKAALSEQPAAHEVRIASHEG